ncbi:MAG TPA: hypothetical protein VFY29_20650 [Terriglobia bacterium]|nr:hypothetical protein [Terriglobia bacterium]
MKQMRPHTTGIGLALLFLIIGSGAGVGAQNYRGEAVPVAERVDPVSFSRIRFLTFAFGREGPSATPLTTQPVAGREYFVEADVFGIESVASIHFELVDGAGRGLGAVPSMWKASDGSTDGEFYGFITVPKEPFRVAVSGVYASSATFRSVFDTLFQPAAAGASDESLLPPGLDANQAKRLQDTLADYRKELLARSSKAAREHPDGVIRLDRAAVSAISYEPLLNGASAPIGVRLRYTIEFPSQKVITAVPHVFPVYSQWDWRGVVTMKALGGTVTPEPEMVAAQSMKDVIVYGAAAIYKARKKYTFVIDMAPDYVFQGTVSGKFCLYDQRPSNRAAFQAILASPDPVPYSLTISDTQTTARIPSFFPQRVFYDNFKAAGAVDCGPTPNIRF